MPYHRDWDNEPRKPVSLQDAWQRYQVDTIPRPPVRGLDKVILWIIALSLIGFWGYVISWAWM